MADLETRLRTVVGDRTATVLSSSLGLESVGDLLRHYPRRYAERGELTDLDDLTVGEHVTVVAEVTKVKRRPMRQRKGTMLEVVVGTGRRALTLTFFNQAWRERDLRVGRRALFAGKVSDFKGVRQLSHPDYQLLDDSGDPDGAAAADTADTAVETFAGALLPVYPASAALASWKVAQCVRLTLDSVDNLEDPLPADLRARRRLLPLVEAFRAVHTPETRAQVTAGTERLKWDEALVLQVALARRRLDAARTPARPRVARPDGLLAAFDARLPFELTGGQVEVGELLTRELAATSPMHRLLQGEVGSGKTVVALRAMLAVVDSGGQAALLAPTEVLATQHARSIRELLGPLGAAGELESAGVAGFEPTRVALLTGSLGAGNRRIALADAADGSAGIVIGTHALLQEGVAFADLGLVVVDEQHRFGVEQREALRLKGGGAGREGGPPHVLVMAATPIPRTVAMTVYGDLETTSLRELPGGRSPIATHVVPPERPDYLTRAWAKVREEVAAGHQAFVVCPTIGDATAGSRGAGEESLDEDDPVVADGPARAPGAAVVEVLPLLQEGELAGLRVDSLHGRLAADVKDDVMRRYAQGHLDVLVATTVIEVGVDVPNATVMVVLDADRFGMSQLHQLRGRIGRGSAAGTCLLVTSLSEGSPGRRRVEAVASTSDGFLLARYDLEQRREGDVLGAAQSGARSSLRLLSLLRDEGLITDAREEATALVTADPVLATHPALRRAIEDALDPEREEYLEKA